MTQIRLARENHKIVRTSHIRAFAEQKVLEFHDPDFNFKAGKSWVTSFKKRNHLSSRRITRLVSRREIQSFDEILEAAKTFQDEIKD